MYFSTKITESTTDETAAMEATFVYHLIKEGQTFQSANCTSHLIREIFGKNPDFRCSETKAEAIATGNVKFHIMLYNNCLCFIWFIFLYSFEISGVLRPMAIDMLLDEIRGVNFIAMCCDTSNKGNFKVLPVMIRYFSHRTGTQTKLIDAFELGDGTGETVYTKLKAVGEKYDIWSKLKAFSAHNAEENFGGLTRGGDKNVFFRLQREFNNQLVGIGCPSHLVHKSVEKACD